MSSQAPDRQPQAIQDTALLAWGVSPTGGMRDTSMETPTRDEQAEAIQSFKNAAETAYFVAGSLRSEVESHGTATLAFSKAWLADPESVDPSEIRRSFGRVEAIYEQLGDLLDQQREALNEMPARMSRRPKKTE